MKVLRRSLKLLPGGLALSLIVMSGSFMPVNLTGEYNTLEELAYQSPIRHDKMPAFHCIDQKMYILQRTDIDNLHTPAELRQAVYRVVIDDK